MDESTLDLSFLNDLEATQVMYNYKDHFNDTDAIGFEETTSHSNYTVTQKNQAKLDCSENHGLILSDIPDYPDDENDDFSWLFKVLPPTEARETDHTVPTEESSLFEQALYQSNTTEVAPAAPPPKESKSMLADAILTAGIDITSLNLNDESSVLTFHKVDENIEKFGEGEYPAKTESGRQNVRRSARAKRSALATIRTNDMITDTPVSLRRSQRKRSYQEMINAEVTAAARDNTNSKVTVPLETSHRTNKRRRIQQKQGESSPITLEQIPTPNNTPAQSESTENHRNPIKIIFRKHKPVNPIDRKLIGNLRNLKIIDSRKVLSGELYLQHLIPPQILPIKEENAPSIMVETPLEPKKIMEALRIQWIEDYNTIANAKAHGKGALGGKQLTSDGNAIRGSLPTIDLLDREYENLLHAQNNLQCVIDWKEKKANASIHNEFEKSVNLENTLVDFSNFKNFFNDDDDGEVEIEENEEDKGMVWKKGFTGITGVVPVNKLAISNDNTLLDKWAIFPFKGQLYRPSPAVINIQRLPDNVIEEIKSKPRKVTLESTYYSALTSYFDKK